MTEDKSQDDRTQSFVALTADTKVSHYNIIERIGSGGMGEVYLALDTKLNRKAALKFLPPHLCQVEDCRKRFTREAQAAAKLDHPNIVPVYEVGEFRERPFFAMAHIQGKSLREIIKESKLTIPEAINYTMQICEGLHKAHESGVVHRDIKPSNVIIDSENRARIVDFGLATVTGAQKLTKTGSTLGTVGYMSPEQIEGKQVDRRSDLFSVGVMLYEMLTGRRPFDGDTDAAVARSITDTTPEPIARYKSGTSVELQQIVDKALEKDRETRYQHADEIRSDILRVLHGAVKSRPSIALKTSGYLSRRPVRAVLAVCAAAIAIISVLLALGGEDEPPPEPDVSKITYSGDVYYGAIAPDGTYYACLKMVDNGPTYRVCVNDLEGGQEIEVFRSEGIREMRWSPSGRELLVRVVEHDHMSPAAVYLVHRMGGQPRRFEVPGSAGGWDIAWLPDGSGFVSVADWNRVVYTDKASGDTTAIQLPDGLADIRDVSFSPDGRWLSFWAAQGNWSGLHLFEPETGRLRRLVAGSYYSSTWSPSGKAVYAVSVSALESRSYSIVRIGIQPKTGERAGEPQAILSNLPGTTGLSISADGYRLLCRQSDPVCVIKRVDFDAESSPRSLSTKEIVSWTGILQSAAISPDGKYVSFSAETGQGVHAFIRPISGSRAVQLSTSGVLNIPLWSPDSNYVAFLTYDSLYDNTVTLSVIDPNMNTIRRQIDINMPDQVTGVYWPSPDSIVVATADSLCYVNSHSGDMDSRYYEPLRGKLCWPALSPDRRWLATCPGGDIWLFSCESETLKLLAEVNAQMIQWNSDGSGLFFYAPENVIALLYLRSGRIDTLALPPDLCYGSGEVPSVSADGDFAIYRVVNQARDLYLIENFEPYRHESDS